MDLHHRSRRDQGRLALELRETDLGAAVKIRINIRAMQQMFHPCTTEFIANICHASCCRSSTDPSGIAVVVTIEEAPRLRALGAVVDPRTLRLQPVNKRCPFQHPQSHLCGLHGSADKPRGCIISPFTINPNGTLIVRNRYRLLPCFKAPGSLPVYEAHYASLVEMFGPSEAQTIRAACSNPALLDSYITAEMPDALASALLYKNRASRSS
jgi:hypothetical protein